MGNLHCKISYYSRNLWGAIHVVICPSTRLFEWGEEAIIGGVWLFDSSFSGALRGTWRLTIMKLWDFLPPALDLSSFELTFERVRLMRLLSTLALI